MHALCIVTKATFIALTAHQTDGSAMALKKQ